MPKSKVTMIVDRHELTFAIFHRDGSDQGNMYYPAKSSRARLARAIANMLTAKQVKIFRLEGKKIYAYVRKDCVKAHGF